VYFEGRELKNHAEAVPVDELKEGSVYFLVDFIDPEMHLPRLEPVVYIGSDLAAGDVGQLYFQDLASYRDGIRFGAKMDEAADPLFVQTPLARMRPVFEFEKALEILMSCSLRRQGVPGTM
jgi:hypothetical protein